MGKIYAFVLGVAAGFGLYHLSISNHVVRASDGFHVVPKVSKTLGDTYVDIRGFTLEQARQHPELGAAIAASGNATLQQEYGGAVAADAIQQGVDTALELLQQ